MKLLLPEFGLLIWTLLAFLVVFFILKKFAWPAIVKGLADREKSIADAIVDQLDDPLIHGPAARHGGRSHLQCAKQSISDVVCFCAARGHVH